MNEVPTTIVTGVSLLNVFIVKDDEAYMAKCPELDLVTEMDTKEQALKAMVEMIIEYAEDYIAQEELYLQSPNRAHHKPYIDAILACDTKLELTKRLSVGKLG